MKKVYGEKELGRVFVKEPTDGIYKPSHFQYRVWQKDVSVLTHGLHEVRRHFQGSRHFARNQRLSLETSRWSVLGFVGNPLNGDELEGQKSKLRRDHLVVRNQEQPIAEGLFAEGACAVNQSCRYLQRCRVLCMCRREAATIL